MRVLTVARWYPSHDSPGRGSFVADLVRATVEAGVEARVASFDRVLVRGRRDDRDATRLAARAAYDVVATPASLFVSRPIADAASGVDRVPIARIPVVRRPGTGDAAALIDDHLAALRPFMAQLVSDWRPDVIHAHTGLPDGIVAATLGRALGIPVIVSEHMSTIESELADRVALERYRELLEPGSRLVGVSPSVALRVAGLLGVSADRLGVLPNPVDADSFPPADPTARDPDELLWVGSIGAHKGIDVLLHAFATLTARRPELRLRLVGAERAEGDRAHLEALAASLGIESSVSFDGWLSRDHVAAAMAHAGVMVHPSPSETFGVAAAEAILTGLPVVARQSGGVPWIIELSGGFGQVARSDDPGSFAEAIERTLDGTPAVAADEARWRLIATIGASAVAGKAVELYEAAVATTRTPATEGPDARIVPRIAAIEADATDAAEADATDAAATRPLPSVLVATERVQAPGLVAALPAELRGRLILVVPSDAPDTSEPPTAVGAQIVTGAQLVTAEPFRPGTPRPRGRSPLARLRRALWRPAPTADDLLGRAVLSAAAGTQSVRGPVEVIAIDAPAAVLISRLDPRRVRLAPGALRWLADRWAAESDHMPPSP